jgi:hypothetical protein
VTVQPLMTNRQGRGCILVTPSPYAAGWVEAADAANIDGDSILVTTDVDSALRHSADDWAIIIPPFYDEGDVAIASNRARDISRALATAADSDGAFAVIDPVVTDFTAPIRLLPDVALRGQIERSAARQEGVRLPPSLAVYRQGRPSPGDVANWEFALFHFAPSVEWREEMPSFDLTGSARILVWGPHIFLSSGRWRVRLRFAIDAYSAKQSFTIDWGGLSSYTRLEGRPGRAGVHEAIIEHDWAFAEVAELRIGLTHAAFSGRFTLQAVTIERA